MFHFCRSIAVLLTLLITSLISASAICSAEKILNEGEWDMTTRMEMKGMPAGMPSLPDMHHSQCITNEMMVPRQKSQSDESCKMIDQSVSGHTVTWHMRCTNDGITSEMNGTYTYRGDTMKGTMIMNSQGMKIVSHITGKRIGPCK